MGWWVTEEQIHINNSEKIKPNTYCLEMFTNEVNHKENKEMITQIGKEKAIRDFKDICNTLFLILSSKKIF